MEIVAFIVIAGIIAVTLTRVAMHVRAREHDRALDPAKLDGVAEGHREMADAHAGSLDELRPLAAAHRQAAADHTRQAQELERRIAREERFASFHADRAVVAAREREQT